MKSIQFTSQLVSIIAIVFILIIGKSIVLPFLFAMLIYLLIRSTHRFLNKNKLVKKYIPSWIKNIFSAVIIFSLLGLILNTIIINAKNLSFSFQKYARNIHWLTSTIEKKLQINLSQTIEQGLEKFDVSHFINPILNSIGTFAGNFILILFYVIFLILEETSFKNKIKLIVSDKSKLDSTNKLLNNIEHSITHYVGLKTLVSLISAITCFFILLFFGVQSPFLWATLIFLLNYIPVVGAFLAVSLPFCFSIIQLGEFYQPCILLLTLSIIQLSIGNFIEPKIMGNSLNISPLVAILSLAIWGGIWGFVGMIVSVPITVILIIISAHFGKTKPIAILLSNKGEI